VKSLQLLIGLVAGTGRYCCSDVS